MMEVYFVHLLKSSGILLLFWSCYQLFLKRETFFGGNRWFLLGGLIFSLLAPFISFTNTVLVTRPSVSNTLVSTYLTPIEQAQNNNQSIDLLSVMLFTYLLGAVFFGTRLFLQFLAIKKLIRSGSLHKELPYYHIQTKENISPFSFFRYIFYHHGTFDQSELRSIIAHEKVHAKEYHSMDILLMEMFLVLLWFNPVIWWYRISLKQNLEFLADSQSCYTGAGKKFYQYLMLKQAVGQHKLTIANPFYSSLIKKRIVMLNQHQSKKTGMLKMFMILPAIAVFLMGFNTKTEYITETASQIINTQQKEDKSIQVIINKDTSNEELEKIKKDLANEGIDFSFTVVHNQNREIIDISVQLSGKSSDGEQFSGNYSMGFDSPIKPITIHYDAEANLVSFGNSNSRTISIHSDEDHDGDIRIHTDVNEHREIHITEKNGIKTIILDGKEISEEEFEEMDMDSDFHIDADEHIKIHIDTEEDKHYGKNKRKNKTDVMIIRDTDDHSDIEVINNKGYLFFDHDGKGRPLFYLDGKKISQEEMKKLLPDDIEKIEVFKGEKAIEKYGKKAKNGVVEITSKSEKK